MELTRYRFISSCSVIVFSLLWGAASHADIYAYTDKNGVRHLSNSPDDPRFKLVMRTPKYRPAESPAPQNGQENAEAPAEDIAATVNTNANTNVGLISGNGRSWRLITPSSDAQAGLAALTDSGSYIRWGKGGKPFSVNQKNRRRWSPTIARVAAKHKLDPHLLHAVISAESAFNPKAVSHAGAMGLMQLMPATAKRFGVDNPFDPEANIRGGATYLRWLLNFFKNDIRLALAGYNAGENAVVRHGRKIPPYKETQNYVKRVLQFYSHYRGGRS